MRKPIHYAKHIYPEYVFYYLRYHDKASELCVTLAEFTYGIEVRAEVARTLWEMRKELRS